MRTPEEVAREIMRTIYGCEPDEVERLAKPIARYAAEVREAARAETLAGFDAFAILLAATREGLARSGSKAKGVEQVREMLAEHAGAIARANEDANDRMRRGRPHWNRPWQPAP